MSNNKDSPVEVNIDTEGLENRIVDKFNLKFTALEEMLAKKEKTTALSEKVGSDKPVDFNWKEGIAEMLRSFKKTDNISVDTWQDRRPVDSVSVVTYNEKTKQHEYGLTEKLVETIGTIAQGANNCCIPEIWADKIERDHVYPGSVFLGAWFVNWYPDIEGKPGDTVRICRVAPSVCVDLSCDEPDTVAPVIACPYITLEHDVCATAICKNDMETVQLGLVDAITEGLGSCLQVCVDNYFFNVALSCTNAGTLACTGPMAGSIIVEAMGSMMAGNQSELKPKKLYDTHVIIPIGVVTCVHSEPQNKQNALTVVTHESVVHLKEKHSVQTVKNTLPLTRNELLNIDKIGLKTIHINIKKDTQDITQGLNHCMRNLEIGPTTNAIYVEEMINDSNFMKEKENHTQLTPSIYEIISKISSYCVNHATKQRIGRCFDLIGITNNSKNKRFNSSDQNLHACKGYHAPSRMGVAHAGHQLQLCQPLRGTRRDPRWKTRGSLWS